MLTNPIPFVIGAGGLFLLWVLYALATGKWDPLDIVEGADGRPSTSKLQFWAWTIVALFSYVALYASRVLDAHDTSYIDSIPHNLLIAMGLSIGTATAAKTITAAYVQAGKIAKTQVGSNERLFSSLFVDDSGVPDLSKMQVLAWTVIGIAMYLITVGYSIGSMHITHHVESLPDIDPALMVLMGLGQGAYLGKKLVTTSTPRLTGISPSAAAAGAEVTVTGLAFGSAADGNQVTYDGKALLSVEADKWTDTSVKFLIPDKNPDGNAWPASGQQVLIGLISNGQE
ncbi:MAG: IPT/TIG domain-containing protein, partial [Blastocatellia bacterium]